MSPRRKSHSLPPLPNVGALIRQHFLAGVLVVVPFWVIGWIIGGFLGALLKLKAWVPVQLQPDHYFSDPTVVSAVSAAFLFVMTAGFILAISLVGWVSRQVLGQKILESLSRIIHRIPVIRSIYSALDQLMRTFAGSGTQQFNRVVYVEWPRKGLWAIAFVTSSAKGQSIPNDGMVNIFVPATPNPTSGFHMIVSESELRETKMTVEEAFRTILSLGIAQS
jgi:uncharacterized membrane protein